MIPSVLQGLVKTAINNAVQTKQPNTKANVPAVPSPRDPKANEAIYQANQAVLAGIKKVTPPGQPLPPPPPTMFSPGVGEITVPPQKTMFDPNVGTIDFSYQLDDAGKTASNMTSAAGIPKVDPIDPAKPQKTQIEDAVGKTINSIDKLLTERKEIIEGKEIAPGKLFGVDLTKFNLKFKTDSINSVTKKINDIITKTDPTELQNALMLEFNKARPVQKVATVRDYFIETDKKGNEKLTRRGEATIVIALLANLFGAPGQGAQTSTMATGIGERFAKEQNVINEAQFKQEVDTFNQKIQGLQAQIGFKTQERERLLYPEKIKLDQFKTQLEQNTELTKSERDNLTKMYTESTKAVERANAAKIDDMARQAQVLYTSLDPNERKSGYAMYQALGYTMVPPPPEITKKEQKFNLDMFLSGLKAKGIATDNQIKLLTLQMKGNEAELYPEMIKARLALLKAQTARALRPPSSGGGAYKITPQDRIDLNIIASNIKDADDNMAAAAEEASFAKAAYDKYAKDPTLTPDARKKFMGDAKADNNAAVDKYNKFKAAKEVNMSAANSYGASGGTTKSTRTTAPKTSGAPTKI